MSNKQLNTIILLLLLSAVIPAAQEKTQPKIKNAFSQNTPKTDREILVSLDNLTLNRDHQLSNIEQPENRKNLLCRYFRPVNSNCNQSRYTPLGELQALSAMSHFEQLLSTSFIRGAPMSSGFELELSAARRQQGNDSNKFSVGIAGEQENLINNLDNSDLMDFEDNGDVWRNYLKAHKSHHDNNDY